MHSLVQTKFQSYSNCICPRSEVECPLFDKKNLTTIELRRPSSDAFSPPLQSSKTSRNYSNSLTGLKLFCASVLCPFV